MRLKPIAVKSVGTPVDVSLIQPKRRQPGQIIIRRPTAVATSAGDETGDPVIMFTSEELETKCRVWHPEITSARDEIVTESL